MTNLYRAREFCVRGSTNADRVVHDRRMAREKEKSCGVLVFQDRPRRSFLLLVARERLDLPKGHIKKSETEIECAMRELEEETGLVDHDIELHEDFRFETTYTSNRGLQKTVVLFAAELRGHRMIVTPDHDDYAWVPWRPPHDFREFPTIHKALVAWHEHSSARTPRRKAS